MLDLAEPVIRQLMSRSWGRGTVTWSTAGLDIASIGYEWIGCAKLMILSFAADGAAQRQRVHLVARRPNFGGVRTHSPIETFET